MTPKPLCLALLAVLALPAAASADEPVRSDVRYEGVLERHDAVGVYAVHVEALRTLDIAFETHGGPEYFDGACLRLLGDADEPLAELCPERDGPPASTTVTVPRGSYRLEAHGERGDIVPTGATYAFTVSAPGGLTTAACLAAQDDGARFAAELHRARARLARAGTRLARKRNRGTIRDLRLAIERARQRQALACAP